MGRVDSYRETGERYPTLRIVGGIFRGLGAFLLAAGGLLLAFGLHAVLMGMTSGPPQVINPFAPRPASTFPFANGLSGVIFIAWGVGLFVSGLQCLAPGAFLRLAIHVEENTRISAQRLDKLCVLSEPRGEEAGRIFLS